MNTFSDIIEKAKLYCATFEGFTLDSFDYIKVYEDGEMYAVFSSYNRGSWEESSSFIREDIEGTDDEIVSRAVRNRNIFLEKQADQKRKKEEYNKQFQEKIEFEKYKMLKDKYGDKL